MLSTSFKTEYRGPGAAALLALLKQAENNFNSSNPARFYARFLSFIQASGTGKTKTVIQVSPNLLLQPSLELISNTFGSSQRRP